MPSVGREDVDVSDARNRWIRQHRIESAGCALSTHPRDSVATMIPNLKGIATESVDYGFAAFSASCFLRSSWNRCSFSSKTVGLWYSTVACVLPPRVSTFNCASACSALR